MKHFSTKLHHRQKKYSILLTLSLFVFCTFFGYWITHLNYVIYLKIHRKFLYAKMSSNARIKLDIVYNFDEITIS